MDLGWPVIPESCLDDIRDRIDVVSVIGRHVELARQGAAFAGRCPFHKEKTASFKVFPETKRFKCFGCQAGGDVFEFLGKVEGKGFREV